MQGIEYPTAPTPAPLAGTLLSAATVVEQSVKWLDNDEALFDSYNCLDFETFVENYCSPVQKNFQGPAGWQYGQRFAAYGGAVCKQPGLDEARMEQQVKEVFERGEYLPVERGLMANRFKAKANRWTAPVDLTPGDGAVPLGWGVALLEGYAATEYKGVPTLHLPRIAASALLGVSGLERDGDKLFTRLGSKIAAGGGYDYPNLGPDGTAAPAGEKWLYATGEVLVLKSDQPTVRQAMAHQSNEVFVLAERAYVVAVDCFTAAVRIQVMS